MTYLELARLLAQESGSVPGDAQPATVTAQTGDLGRIVRWINDAWRDIQNLETGWLWMRSEFSGDTLLNIDAYASGGLGTTRLRDWIVRMPYSGVDSGVTVYPTGKPAEEGALIAMDWESFRRTKLRAAPPASAPRFVTVDPQRRLRLAPKPDGVYVISGEYIRAPQTLVANGDVPELPEHHHHVIVSRALDYVGTDDEATAQVPAWSARTRLQMAALRTDQLPRMGFPGPLA